MLKLEIMDTIMKTGGDAPKETAPVQQDIEMEGRYEECVLEPTVSRIPFRMYINEMMGVTPSYSLLGNRITVDVEMEWSGNA